MAINKSWEVDDMGHRIARFFEPLLRLLLPGTGHRRRTATARGGAHRRRPVLAPSRPHPHPRPGHEPPRGEDGLVVRPHLLSHERREAPRRQHPARYQPPPGRRALFFAPHGVEVHPHLLRTPTKVPA
ncbi:hypothetical protein ABZ354_05870 [Streptomyces sp. NPDC005925]|uniref:hypothetical protein n=1 Tax=Streptomyces sp. NPDC005925 TaxID=3157172 RepID=UPI0033D597DC